MYPLYLEAHASGKLAKTSLELFKKLENCSICPRKCNVNRLNDESGFCKTGLKAVVYSYMPHYGEEPAVSGNNGSGTIFFSNCNMSCCYCQNYEFSQKKAGKEMDSDELAEIMLRLQQMHCHNINFVSPTHVLPQILKALELAIGQGLKIPLVYNSGGYESAEIIKLLEGIVDIYLPDMRYAQSSVAQKYSAALNYPEYNRQTIKEMQRQVGIAEISDDGIIKKGMIIRHLVLPENISGTEKIMKFIAEEVSVDTYISLMSQYYPCYKAREFKELNRRISAQEYEDAQALMYKYGLSNGWVQESHGLARFAGENIKPVF